MKHHLLLSLALLSALPAWAAKMTMPSDAPKSYEAECASCHMAYPPGLLGPKNWQNIMSGLHLLRRIESLKLLGLFVSMMK